MIHYVFIKRADNSEGCAGRFDSFREASDFMLELHKSMNFTGAKYVYMLTTSEELSDADTIDTNFKYVERKTK